MFLERNLENYMYYCWFRMGLATNSKVSYFVQELAWVAFYFELFSKVLFEVRLEFDWCYLLVWVRNGR